MKRRKKVVVHLLPRVAFRGGPRMKLKRYACGMLSRPTTVDSLHPDDVTCRKCCQTVAFKRSQEDHRNA